MPKIEVLNIRVEAPMRRAIEREAAADARTTAAMVRKMIAEWLAANGLQPPRKSVRNGAASATVARQKREGRNHAKSPRAQQPVD